jgi:hypothetical protein
MNDSKKKSKMPFGYNARHEIAIIVFPFIWCAMGWLGNRYANTDATAVFWFIAAVPCCLFFLNTILYLYEKLLLGRYIVSFFSDARKETLTKKHEYNRKALQFYKFAGLYMLIIIVLLACINMYLAAAIAMIGYIVCLFYGCKCEVYGTKGSDRTFENRFPHEKCGRMPHSSWGDAHIRGTVEASSTGNALCGRHREDPFGDSWGGSMFRH